VGGGDLVEQSLAAAADDHLIAALTENLGEKLWGSGLGICEPRALMHIHIFTDLTPGLNLSAGLSHD